MKLKYIFTLLGVMLLGLTSCGKKDAPKTESNNPFAGTQWERTTTETNEYGDTEITIDEIHFVDDTRLSHQSIYKTTAKDGSIKDQGKTPKAEVTYTHKGLVATSIFPIPSDKGVHNVKFTFTMDEAKQKLTGVASSEGEKDQTMIFTRKK